MVGAAANRISIDAATVLSELGGIFVPKEEQRAAQKAFLSGNDGPLNVTDRRYVQSPIYLSPSIWRVRLLFWIFSIKNNTNK